MRPILTLLGTGGPAPDLDRGATAAVIQIGGQSLLFDAGRGVVRQLMRAGIALPTISSVFITHHHFDHIGDLHDVILSTWLLGRPGRIDIYGPPETRRIVDALLTQVYDKDIEFRDQGEPAVGGWKPVAVTDVTSGVVCETTDWRVTADLVEHGTSHPLADSFRRRWVCLGFRFECDAGVIAISGDTVDCDGLRQLARDADILVQCCYLSRSEILTERQRQVARHTLACADTVGKIAAAANVKKLVLTHHRPKSSAALAGLEEEVRQDFGGNVVAGRDLMSFEL